MIPPPAPDICVRCRPLPAPIGSWETTPGPSVGAEQSVIGTVGACADVGLEPAAAVAAAAALRRPRRRGAGAPARRDVPRRRRQRPRTARAVPKLEPRAQAWPRWRPGGSRRPPRRRRQRRLEQRQRTLGGRRGEGWHRQRQRQPHTHRWRRAGVDRLITRRRWQKPWRS